MYFVSFADSTVVLGDMHFDERNPDQVIGIRFSKVSISDKGTLVAAYIQFTSAEEGEVFTELTFSIHNGK